jgi:hypothetical protein
MSLTRNREEFRPHNLENIRMKYFGHLERKEKDVPPPPPPVPEEAKEPYFAVKTVRRAPKIEDEDVDYVPDMADFHPGAASQVSLAGPAGLGRPSRSNSIANSMYSGYGNAPFGARVHRASWSSRDFQNYHENDGHRADSPFGTPSRSGSGMGHNLRDSSVSMAPLVRPSASHSSMRSSTPTREQQRQYVNQRVGLGQ